MWVSELVDVIAWLIAWLIDQSSYQASEWVDVGEWVSGCDWLIQWVSEWMSAWEWVDVGWWEWVDVID